MSIEDQTTEPGVGERIEAAAAHVSVIFLLAGILVPPAIWLLRRNGSSYVRFQALQAMAYQLSIVLGWTLAGALYVFFTIGIPYSASGTVFYMPIRPAAAPLLCGVLFWLAALVYGLIGAIRAGQGHVFRYLYIGDLLEGLLGPDEEPDPVTDFSSDSGADGGE